MRKIKHFKTVNWICLVFLSVISNSFALLRIYPKLLYIMIPVFIIINVIPGIFDLKTRSVRLRVTNHGVNTLSIFAASIIPCVIFHVVYAFFVIPGSYMRLIWSLLFCVVCEGIYFWNGIICVYCTSIQLGIDLRVKGALSGIVPILNIIFLSKIIHIVSNEVEFESKKEEVNESRKAEQICKTKYPILFVHGVFFRDSKFFNYWGRIPKELINNGAVVFYGEHQSAQSIAESAQEIADRINDIIEKEGCEKVNIIAHSKGGLDSRYAISELGIASKVASLTTINTPHRGCKFTEQLLKTTSSKLQNYISKTYNSTFKKLGDQNPDFMEAVNDLTATSCEKLNEKLVMPEGIFCQSFGSRLNSALGGKFPMNVSYNYVKKYDGSNDGLVGEDSFEWGEQYRLITVKGKRGVSHGDMIDLNRENIPEFDVREFYVELVSELKNRGL